MFPLGLQGGKKKKKNRRHQRGKKCELIGGEGRGGAEGEDLGGGAMK